MNRNEQSGEKKEGKDSGGRGELENRTGRVAWTICRGDFFFFFFVALRQANRHFPSQQCPEKKGRRLLQEGCRDNVV